MSQACSNTASDGSIVVLSPTQGEGFGAEAVLEEMLRGWPEGLPPLVVVSPGNSRFVRICDETPHHHIVSGARRDAIVPNLLGLNALSLPSVTRVHAWSARAFELALLLGRRLRVPVSGTQHDHPEADFIGATRRKIMRHASNRFAALGCVSQATLEACRASGYRARLEVVHNGLSDFDITRVPAGTQVRVGFLGMRAKRKGFDLLRQWMPDVLANDCVVLKLYGEPHPDFGGDLENLVRAYPGRVIPCGQRPRADIFGEIDVLLHASNEFEPFATVLLEAALAGVPCVASSAGGAPEAVIDGKTGVLFDPDQPDTGRDALMALCADPARRAQLGREARRHYEQHFRVENMVRAYERLWRIR